jgi:hypothetical protein
MATLLTALAGICGLVGLVCFVMVLIAMFKNGQAVLGIVCIVGFFCLIGYLIAFVFGWMKAAEWNLKQIMLAWSGAIAGWIVFGALANMMGGG